MVTEKKNGVSIQRKPRKEKRGKEKHEYGPVNPKEQENRDNTREVGEILGDMQSRATRGSNNSEVSYRSVHDRRSHHRRKDRS